MSDDLVFEVEEYEFEQLEEGTYLAQLKDIQRISTQYGESLKWFFDVEVEDEETGGTKIVTVSGLTRAKVTKKNKTYKWFKALGGRENVDGTIDLRSVIGNKCLIHVVVREGRDGAQFSNVDDVLPPPKEMRESKKKSKKSKKSKKTEPEPKPEPDEFEEDEFEVPEVEEYDMSS